MDGLRALSGEVVDGPRVPATEWLIVGAGDFTGADRFSPRDGRLDLVWQSAGDARVAIWTMNGTTVMGGREIQWYEGWKVRAVADLTGDGDLDFVVQHDSTEELGFIRYNPLVPTGSSIHRLIPASVDDVDWRIVGPR